MTILISLFVAQAIVADIFLIYLAYYVIVDRSNKYRTKPLITHPIKLPKNIEPDKFSEKEFIKAWNDYRVEMLIKDKVWDIFHYIRHFIEKIKFSYKYKFLYIEFIKRKFRNFARRKK